MTFDRDDRGFMALIGFMFFGFLLVWVASGCAHTAPAPKPLVETKVITVPVEVRCAHEPPPEMKPIHPFSCPVTVEGKTADGVCLTQEDAMNLADDIDRLDEWVETTWSACSPNQAPAPGGAPAHS